MEVLEDTEPNPSGSTPPSGLNPPSVPRGRGIASKGRKEGGGGVLEGGGGVEEGGVENDGYRLCPVVGGRWRG